MSTISTILSTLRSAVWAIDVRDEIANAIEQCYKDVNSPSLVTDGIEEVIGDMVDNGRISGAIVEDLGLITEGTSNLFDFTTVTAGRLNTSTGEVGEASGYWTSDFIPVENGKTYYFANTDRRVAYNSSKAYSANISGTTWTASADGYIRVSVTSANRKTAKINEGSAKDYRPGRSPIDFNLRDDVYRKAEVDAALAAVTIATDPELETAGAAADAKATGDAISALNESLGNKVGVSDRNIVTYDMLYKNNIPVTSSVVNFWYYNNTKRTDGTSIEIVPPLNTVYTFTYPEGTNVYRVYYVSDDGTTMGYDSIDNSYGRMIKDTANRRYYMAALKAGKFYIPLTFGATRYFPDDTEVVTVDEPQPINFLKTGWMPEIMNATAKYPRRVYAMKCYSSGGALQSMPIQIPMYHIPYVGWYKCAENVVLLDDEWNFVEYKQKKIFYNDGSYAYVQGTGVDKDVQPEYIGQGITELAGMPIISKGDVDDLNKARGKTIVCFGDSITSTGYPEKLMEFANCVAINKGESGDTSGRIRKMLTGVGSEVRTPFDWSENPIDICIIMAGYNDTYQGAMDTDVPSTTISDASNDWSAYLALFNTTHQDAGTTTGNVAFMIEWLQVNHPEVRILVCNYHNNNDSKPERAPNIDVAVHAVCEYYGVQLIDIRRTCGISKKNASTYTTDGLHPNAAGQGLIAKAILRGM